VDAEQQEPDHDPLFGVTRGVRGCVLVRWSELTPAEQEKAWRDYEKAFGADERKDSK
jgi:hypothetical protein